MVLAALLLAAFRVNPDTTLVNVALPAMVRQLHATTTQLQWVVDAYNLVFAALLLTFGSLTGSAARGCCWLGWPWWGSPAWPAGSSPARASSSRPGR
jgi:MFS family permease